MKSELERFQAVMQANDDATIRQMATAGYSDGEIGAHLNRDRQWVRRHRCAMGVTPGHQPRWGTIIARLSIRRRGAIAA